MKNYIIITPSGNKYFYRAKNITNLFVLGSRDGIFLNREDFKKFTIIEGILIQQGEVNQN